MSAIWRRAAQLLLRGFSTRDAFRQARQEVEPRHVHDWIEVTRIGDTWRREWCYGCDATRETYPV